MQMRNDRSAQRNAFAVAALCLATAGFFLCAPAWTQGSPPDDASSLQYLTGHRVAAVRIIGESGAVLAENPADLPMAAGQPYDPDAVRESLKQLYRTGRYADVQAQAARLGESVRLDFLVRENFFVNRVRVVGLREPPSEATALSAMRLTLGEIFEPRKLAEAQDRLARLLQDESFFRAKITHAVERNPETRQIDITFAVESGPRARIGEVQAKNQTPFSDKELVAKAGLKRGKKATSLRLSRGGERLRNYLVDKGHLGSRVTVTRGTYDQASNTLPLELDAVAGPHVRVEVSGARVSGDDLRELIPIYQEGAVDADLLNEGRRNLRSFFEREGYFDTAVTYTTSEEEGTLVIHYHVERGDRRRLVGMDVAGNEYFGDALLLERMQIAPASFLSRGRFNTRLLEDEVDSLRAMYVANGFRQVEVRSELLQDYNGKKGDLFVRFHVTEGPQARVAELHLQGNSALDDDFLLSYVNSGPGQPHSEFNLAGDRNNILALYFNNGFPEARVEMEMTPAEEPDRVRLTYRIHEGRQVRVSRVLLDGYEFTRRDVIERQIRVEPHGPLRHGDVIDTQRNLYDLGIFSRVQVAPQNPTGADHDKTMVVLVDEARRYTIAYGGGIEFQRLESRDNPAETELRASPRGLFEISKANVFGRAHTVSLKARASTLQGRALATYSAPNFLRRPELTFLTAALYDRTRDVSTFTADRYEASTQVAWRRTPSDPTTLLLRYSFRRVVVDRASLRIDPSEVPLASQPTRISGPGFTWIRDRRDRPADATRGNFNTFDASIAVKEFGSSASFVRFFLQNSSFHPIGRNLVFARSARLGVQEPFADTIVDEIPLPERYFAGGAYSLRGFGLNQAGPRDLVTGFPVGGLALLAFNQELRFPLRLPWTGDKLGGAFFYDAGNVFTSIRHITLRPEPRDPARCLPSTSTTVTTLNCHELNFFAHAIGIGLRYATPVGPVRLDLGYLLNPARFVTDDGMGNLTRERLPRFQFFLSIGSLF